MKNIQIAFISILIMVGCGESKKNETTTNPPPISDNSMNALDWSGTYLGTLPCADCEGITTELTINTDQTFTLKTTYLGQMDTPFVTVGTFQWDKDGKIITLQTEGADDVHHYQVGENMLFKLDTNGHRIEGDLANNYILNKQ